MKNELFSELSKKIVENSVVARELLEECFESDEPHALGMAYDFITDKNQYERIRPTLSWGDAHHFVRTYYRKCIKSDFDSEWADSRFSAILDCKNWIEKTWPEIDEAERNEWMQWAKDLSLDDSDAAMQILDAMTEHRGKS